MSIQNTTETTSYLFIVNCEVLGFLLDEEVMEQNAAEAAVRIQERGGGVQIHGVRRAEPSRHETRWDWLDGSGMWMTASFTGEELDRWALYAPQIGFGEGETASGTAASLPETAADIDRLVPQIRRAPAENGRLGVCNTLVQSAKWSLTHLAFLRHGLRSTAARVAGASTSKRTASTSW